MCDGSPHFHLNSFSSRAGPWTRQRKNVIRTKDTRIKSHSTAQGVWRTGLSSCILRAPDSSRWPFAFPYSRKYCRSSCVKNVFIVGLVLVHATEHFHWILLNWLHWSRCCWLVWKDFLALSQNVGRAVSTRIRALYSLSVLESCSSFIAVNNPVLNFQIIRSPAALDVSIYWLFKERPHPQLLLLWAGVAGTLLMWLTHCLMTVVFMTINKRDICLSERNNFCCLLFACLATRCHPRLTNLGQWCQRLHGSRSRSQDDYGQTLWTSSAASASLL